MDEHLIQDPTVRQGAAQPSRRAFLGVVLVGSLGLLATRLFSMGATFLRPRIESGMFGGIFHLGSVADLPAPGDPPVSHPAGRFYLVNTDRGVLALDKVCTHLDCLVAWDEQATHFVCPCHGSRFAIDGAYLSGPAERSLDRFSVALVTPAGDLVAETDPALGVALPLPSSAADPYSGDSTDAQPAVVEAAAEADLQLLVDTGHMILGSARV
jgi:cytochrome b6-f complex iron-sulfur subunit